MNFWLRNFLKFVSIASIVYGVAVLINLNNGYSFDIYWKDTLFRTLMYSSLTFALIRISDGLVDEGDA